MDYERADALNQAIRTVAIRHRALAASLLGRLGLHPGQEVLLFELDSHGPRTQTELAAASGCEAPTITNTARKLEAAGLIVRRPSPTDGRVTIVELSDRSRDLMPVLRQAWCELAEQSVAGLTSTAYDDLTSALADLAGSLTRAPASE